MNDTTDHGVDAVICGMEESMIFNVLDYGAKGDAVTNDGPAIQAAINACRENGGGQVFVPGGRTYKTGSLVLYSHVELHLDNGSRLKASDDIKDFGTFAEMESLNVDRNGVPTYMNCEYAGKPVNYFIYAKDTEYVSITGFGTIDGNEEAFYGEQNKYSIEGAYYPRVPLLFMEHDVHLTIQNVTLTGSAFWTTHLVGCEDVLIDGVRILNNLRMMNCDGIDPDHCKNVRISNCHIETADDCIVFKNTASAMEYGPCQNICVTNCTLVSTSAAIKFGTESEDDFSNIVVSNCNITRTNRAISMQLRDPGNIRNCIFSNLNIETRRFSHHWWGEGEPIAITAVDRKDGVKAGTIRNIKFQNINCYGENGVFIHGNDPENKNISDITFENITVELAEKTDWPKINHDLRPCSWEGILDGTLNSLFCRNASDIRVHNFKTIVQEPMKKWVEQEIDVADTDGFVMD